MKVLIYEKDREEIIINYSSLSVPTPLPPHPPPNDSDSKDSVCNAGDLGSIPGSGRSPGEGNGYQLQYSCLENPMDRGEKNCAHEGAGLFAYFKESGSFMLICRWRKRSQENF